MNAIPEHFICESLKLFCTAHNVAQNKSTKVQVFPAHRYTNEKLTDHKYFEFKEVFRVEELAGRQRPLTQTTCKSIGYALSLKIT